MWGRLLAGLFALAFVACSSPPPPGQRDPGPWVTEVGRAALDSIGSEVDGSKGVVILLTEDLCTGCLQVGWLMRELGRATPMVRVIAVAPLGEERAVAAFLAEERLRDVALVTVPDELFGPLRPQQSILAVQFVRAPGTLRCESARVSRSATHGMRSASRTRSWTASMSATRSSPAHSSRLVAIRNGTTFLR